MLNKLIENPELSALQQLVLVTGIRRLISGTDEPPISEILKSNILNVIATLFRFNDTQEEIRIMKVNTFILLMTYCVYSWKQFGY